MKKCITLFVTLCMLLSVFSANMITAYAEDEATLLFELEINGVDGEGVNGETTTVAATAATQANIQSGSELSIESITAAHTDAPIFHQEGTIKYLTFARDVQENKVKDEETGEMVGNGTYSYTKEDSRIVVPMAHSLDIANKDSLTFETWIRPVRDTRVTGQKGDYNRIFSFGSARGIDGVNPHKNLFEFNWMLRNAALGGPRFDNDNQNSDANDQNSFYSVTASGDTQSPANAYMEEFDNTWMHIVITREWIDTDASANKGKWTNKLWINGAYRGFKTGNETTRSAITTGTAGNPMNHLVIGGYTNAAEAFRGDVSTFKMYDGILTEAQVRANYETTRNTYYPPANGRKIFGMDIKDDGTGVAPTADSTAAAIMLDNSLSGSYVLPTRMVEDDIEFLRFASLNSNNEFDNVTSQVTVKLNDYEISDEENITVEAWVRPDYSLNTNKTGLTNFSGRMALFSVGRHPKFGNIIAGSTAVKDAYRVQFEDAKDADNNVTAYGTMVFSNKTDRAEKATLMDLSSHDGQWKHYVITRTWIATPSGPNAGTWSHKLYVDGKLAAEGTVNSAERYDYSQLAYEGRTDHNTSDYLAIGGTTGGVGNSAFHGDIAEFALYAGELSAEDIAEKYSASRNLYHPVSVVFKNENGDVLTKSNIASANSVKIDDIVIKNFAGTEDSMVVLAVYSGNSLVDYEKLVVTIEDGVATITSSGIDELGGKNITDVRVFVWESLTTLRPLFPAFCL